ncbi:MAG TPA: hypothetical protein VEA69_22680 [Tepidisphaeraceae bacterium]|nr:hypothetical protein [Tepidisphaeraceae bacterium]
MRPGQLHPNEFEVAILDRLNAAYPDLRLAAADLHVVSREFTGVGSFSNFLVRGRPKAERRALNIPAYVSIPGLVGDLGLVAFFEGDSLTIEAFAAGGEWWDGVFEGFTIYPPA